MDLLVHIDALDAAAALTRVESCTVDDLLGGPSGIHVGSNIGRILASKFKAHTDGDSVVGEALDGESIGN
jgi:hypothetical protein